MTVYLQRDIAVTILNALEEMPVVVITGMRQTGKSTFLQEDPGLRGRRYVTLDDFASLEAAKEDPDNFIESDEPITIDEVQKCPELLTAIKRYVDKHRKAGQSILPCTLLTGARPLAELKINHLYAYSWNNKNSRTLKNYQH